MLQNNERFKNDIHRYQENINKLHNQQDVSVAKQLLTELIHAVKNIDAKHQEMVYAKQLPTQGDEMRLKIIELRKKLDTVTKTQQLHLFLLVCPSCYFCPIKFVQSRAAQSIFRDCIKG